MVVNVINDLKVNTTIGVVHSRWEGNTLVELFTILVFGFAGNFQYNNLEQVPPEGKSIIMLHKINTPNTIRIA